VNHCEQVLKLLHTQIPNPQEVEDTRVTAEEVAKSWVDPTSGGSKETNGLIYGLVQSGKTGVLTVTGGIGADQGYRTILVLTSDIDPLYDQTLGRIREAFPGMDTLGKADIKDRRLFLQRIKGNTCAIVVTKNASLLEALIENLEAGKVKGLSCLIIDDEADQASLNTRTKKADGTRSTINDRITTLRKFFDKNTYLQVTATPGALFLQDPGHDFRPKFTVLSHPGAQYVGGEDFFGVGSKLIEQFPASDILALTPASQPTPRMDMPHSLLAALDTFMVGATFKRHSDPKQNCAFLCHVSTRTTDHKHIVDLLTSYKLEFADKVRAKNATVVQRLRRVYDALCATHPPLLAMAFDDLLSALGFFAPSIAVKLVNGETDEDVAVRSPYNLFVGGNKLGRGVTIHNLLVSYYGRHPHRPQADTVLQHARMYGYRRNDLGLLRLFLTPDLHTVFRAINKMQKSLRDLIAQSPNEAFRAIYLEGGLKPTRANVLAPGAIGAYTGGSTYNPSQVMRDASVGESTAKIDALLKHVGDKTYVELPMDVISKIIGLTRPDDSQSERVWNPIAIAGSIDQFAKVHNQKIGLVYVDRDRGLVKSRRETQGYLEGGEGGNVPANHLTLFMLRTKETGSRHPAWWPQIRFPSGRYAFAFAI